MNQEKLLMGCLLLTICRLAVAGAQSGDFAAPEPGTTTLVTAEGVTGLSYLLYIPESYDPDHPPPLMVYFDPGGHAGYGMENLRPSCEKAGWILACAKQLRNTDEFNLFGNPKDMLMEREFMDDVRRRVVYDRARFYLAGLCGGAYRANSVARGLWGEAAGMLLLGTWIGDYDDYIIFPDRLAVARVNGRAHGASYFAERDRAYYDQTAVRVWDVLFDGGKEIAPPEYIDQALAWLNEDFQQHGKLYVPPDFEEKAGILLEQAQAFAAAAQCSRALQLVVEILHHYPMSSHVRAAETLLVELFRKSEPQGQELTYTPLDESAWDISRMLMQRGLRTMNDLPSDYPLAFFEAAIMACSTNERALATLAYCIARDPALARRHWQRADEALAQAKAIRPDAWFTHIAQGTLAKRLGNLRKAEEAYRRALEIVRDPDLFQHRSWCAARVRSTIYERRLLPQAGQVMTPPFHEGGECSPRGPYFHGTRGWVVPWGTAVNQEQVAHTGAAALALKEPGTLVVLNAAPLTNKTVWVDFYIMAGRAEQNDEPPILPMATALFTVNERGLLQVFDGSPAEPRWTTLEHPPLPTQTWARITLGIDLLEQVWCVRVNDELVAEELGLAHDTHVFSGQVFAHGGSRTTYLDTIAITTTQPSPGADPDGMPDAWEREHPLPMRYQSVRITVNGRRRHAYLQPADNPFCQSWWEGDVLLVATNSARILIEAETTGRDLLFLGQGTPFETDETAAGLAEPASYEQAVRPIFLPGFLNGLFRISFNEKSHEYAIRFLGLNDADGDQMADEWELLHFGSPTGADPDGNPDGDAWTNIEEYFRNTDPHQYDFYSRYDRVTVAKDAHGWVTDRPPMELIDDHLHKKIIHSRADVLQLKFVANDSWEINWGQADPPGAHAPWRDRAVPHGNNIVLTNAEHKSYFVFFNEKTEHYDIVPIQEGWATREPFADGGPCAPAGDGMKAQDGLVQ